MLQIHQSLQSYGPRSHYLIYLFIDWLIDWFFLFCPHHGIWSCWARDWIQATVATYTTAVAMPDPLTHCAGPGIKPASWHAEMPLILLCHSGNSHIIFIAALIKTKKIFLEWIPNISFFFFTSSMYSFIQLMYIDHILCDQTPGRSSEQDRCDPCSYQTHPFLELNRANGICFMGQLLFKNFFAFLLYVVMFEGCALTLYCMQIQIPTECCAN